MMLLGEEIDRGPVMLIVWVHLFTATKKLAPLIHQKVKAALGNPLFDYLNQVVQSR